MTEFLFTPHLCIFLLPVCVCVCACLYVHVIAGMYHHVWFLFYFIYFYIEFIISVCVCVKCATLRMWRSDGNFWKLVFFFHYGLLAPSCQPSLDLTFIFDILFLCVLVLMSHSTCVEHLQGVCSLPLSTCVIQGLNSGLQA